MSKICVEKKLVYFSLFIIAIAITLIFSSRALLNTATSYKSKASAPKSKSMVIGGKFANANDYPFFVSVSYGCGGSLIGPQWVLTAKHCVLDEAGNIKKPSDLLIMTDYVDQAKSLTNYDLLNNSPDAEEIFLYEDKWSEVGQEENSVYYQKTGFLGTSWIKYSLNDIALVKLSSPMNLPTISFPKSDWALVDAYKKGIILGTGNVSESMRGEKDEQNIPLKYGEVIIKPNVETLYDFNKVVDTHINERFLFASYIDTWAIGASGDSGGPIVADNGQKKLQVGIMKDVGKNIYTVTSNAFVKVSYYSNWISRTTGIQPESGTWNGSLIPTPPQPTLIPSATPIPTITGKPICSGTNRFCSTLDRCEDFGDGHYHESQVYRCGPYSRCCEEDP